MSQKTVEVRALLDHANHVLAFSTGENGRARREGVISFIENILHGTDNYNGFGYLGVDYVPKGELPGVMSIDDYIATGGDNPLVLAHTSKQSDGSPDRVFPDDTRRQYIVGRLDVAKRPLR